MEPRALPLRVRLRRVWRQGQFAFIVLLALIGTILGYVGLQQQNHYQLSVADALFADFHLWSGQAPDEVDHLSLNIARFLLPATAGYSGLVAASVLLRKRLLALRASRAVNHIVVAGCGDTGLAFVLSARRKGRKVTVIDKNANNPLIEICQAAGVHVVVADATDPEALATARVEHASDLVLVCPDDDVNTTIALQAMASPMRRRLRIAARVRDATVGQVLRAYQLHCEDRHVVLEVFDVDHVAAPLLLDRASEISGGGTLALLGDHPVFAHLLRELSGREDARIDTHAPAFDGVVLVTEFAPAWLPTVMKTWGDQPPLDHVEMSPRLAALSPPAAVGRATVALVGVDGDGHSLATALLLEESSPARLRVLACLRRTPDPQRLRGVPGVEVFDVVAGVCTPELLDRAMIDTLARAIHERYVGKRAAEDADPGEASMVAWPALDEVLKDSNRDQASHIGSKLRAIHCGVVPLGLGIDLPFAFTPEELERLGELEHERWVAERVSLGWTPGPKNVAARTTPYLVPWAELDEDIRELDREAVEGIPELLARVGYGIVRADRPV